MIEIFQKPSSKTKRYANWTIICVKEGAFQVFTGSFEVSTVS